MLLSQTQTNSPPHRCVEDVTGTMDTLTRDLGQSDMKSCRNAFSTFICLAQNIHFCFPDIGLFCPISDKYSSPRWEMCITSWAGSPALKHLKDKFVASRTNRPNLTSTMPRRAAAQICSKGTRQKIPGWVHNKIFWYLKKDPTKFTKLGRVSKDKSFSENKEKKLNTEKNLVSTIFIMSTCLWCPTCPPYSSPSRPVRDVPLY